MANVSRINGFRPVKHLNGSPFNGQVNKYNTTTGDATSLFIGDVAVIQGTADADGVMNVKRGAANAVAVGVVVSIEPDPTNLTLVHRSASTQRYVYIADSPDLVFEVQEDAVGGAMPTTSVGLNANFIVGTGSTITGQSAMQLDTDSADTVNTLPLFIVGFVPRPDNEVGVANAKVLVTFNTHQYKATTGSAGVA